jgi:hypothetical protein
MDHNIIMEIITKIMIEKKKILKVVDKVDLKD